jgi:hypothetical protein
MLKKLINWFTKLFGKAKDAYEKLEEASKPVVRVAVNVVQALKTFNESPTADIVAVILGSIKPGEADDILIANVRKWLNKELPKLAIKLTLVDSTINLKTPDEKLKAIINAFQLSENKGEKALAFAAQLAVYLEDGKLSYDELKEAANDYYNKFLK